MCLLTSTLDIPEFVLCRYRSQIDPENLSVSEFIGSAVRFSKITFYNRSMARSLRVKTLDKYINIIYNFQMKPLHSMPDFEGFDWDQGNIEKNWLAHAVTPQEAEQVFFNNPLLVADDETHSKTERRFFVLGQTDKNRPLFIAFTLRKRRIRVISARDMNRKERKVYLA
jgi:uncharacterized DUF497 family protein